MDPLTLGLVVVGALVLLLGLVALFALRADFEFEKLDVRGGQVKGVIAAAVAKLLVGDKEGIEIPLAMTLRKTGPLGASTPIVGGVTCTDLELRLFLDNEHVSTIKDATTFHIGAMARRIQLPVNASLHPPAGLLKTAGKLRKVKNMGSELALRVEGFVQVSFWGIRRRVAVDIERALVLGDPMPQLHEMLWLQEDPEEKRPALAEATLQVRLENPYTEERLTGAVRIDVVQPRRLRRAAVVGTANHTIQLAPGAHHVRRLRIRLERPAAEKGAKTDKDLAGVRVRPRVFWNGERLRLPEEPDLPAEAAQLEQAEEEDEKRHIRLRIHRVRARGGHSADDDVSTEARIETDRVSAE